jgi:hypothetical protein
MQKQLAAQQREIESLKAQSKAPAATSISNESLPTQGERTAHLASSSALQPEIASGAINTECKAAAAQEKEDKGKSQETPLGSFKVGGAELELGGFVDFKTFFVPRTRRTTLPPRSPLYHSAIRRRGRSRNFVARRSIRESA